MFAAPIGVPETVLLEYTKSSKKSAPSKKSPTAKSAPVGTAKKNVQRDTASILAAALSEKKPGPTSKAEAPAFSKPAAKPAAKKATSDKTSEKKPTT